MTRVLITGAGGFVGPYLIKELQNQTGTEIFASIYSPSSDITKLLPEDHIIAGDLTSYEYTKQLISISKPEIIYHLASLSIVGNSVENASRVLTSNITLQYNLLEAMRAYAPESRLVAICSANEYGYVAGSELPIKETQPLRPLNPYAVSKVTQEMLSLQYHRSYGLDVVVLRPFNHTGAGQTEHFVVPALAKQFVEIERNLKAPTIHVGNLDTVRDFTDVHDMVRAYILAASCCESGEVYNIGAGRGSSIGKIIELLQEISKLKVEIEEEQSRTRSSDVPVLVADSSKFREITGWEPNITFKETLRSVLEYYRGQAPKVM